MKTHTKETAIRIRKATERGQANFGWLTSRHSFSFGNYYDPAHMGFRSLRVINDDRVAGGGGFPTHPHSEMEIFSYVLEGKLAHKDSMGNQRTLESGQIQLMSAGRGVTHSEFNPDQDVETHFFQIWLHPNQSELTPSYTEWRHTPEQEQATKVLVISPDGRDGSATIHQDAEIYRIRLKSGDSVNHSLREGRGIWVQIMTGSATLNGAELHAGDGASAEVAGDYEIRTDSATEALVFDLA